MKTNFLKFLFVIAFMLISTSATYAKWAVLCGYFQNQYHCYAVNRSCGDVSGVPLAEWTCKDLAIMAIDPNASGGSNRFNANKLIRGKDGRASFFIKGELIAISSDALEAKMEEFAKLSDRQLMGDEKLKMDFEAFLAADKGIVSDERLQDISKETGLPIGKLEDDANIDEQRTAGTPIQGTDVGLEGDPGSTAVLWTDYNSHDPGVKVNPSPKTDANGSFAIKLKEGKYNLILPRTQLAKLAEGTDRKPPLKQNINLFLTVQAADGTIFDRWGNLITATPKENITIRTGKIVIIIPKEGGVLTGMLTSENIK